MSIKIKAMHVFSNIVICEHKVLNLKKSLRENE